MTFRALCRKLGFAGVIASLFAFLLMGASVQCGPSMRMDAAATHAVAHSFAGTVEHTHDKAGHGHHSSTSDTCKDSCCGTGCHLLTGPQLMAAADLVYSRGLFSLATDRAASGAFPFSIERPPRA